MFRPTESVVRASQELISCLSAVDCSRASGHQSGLNAELNRKRPDLTQTLLALTVSAQEHHLELGETLTAATVRAACTRLGKQHPGATIEVRVPPWAAVQIGFETGSRHTRGTPPNVVEVSPEVFLGLVTGWIDWDTARPQLSVSGAHAADAARAFPL
ncbi:hypothetical protein GCM10028820_19010 [Tessaracoccus terricola]